MALHLQYTTLSFPSTRRNPVRPSRNAPRFSCSLNNTHRYSRPYTTVMIVPTGVGASIGGYAGDALPVARTLASVADCVISHPNAISFSLNWCLMQQCFTGHFLMYYMWKAMLLIALRKTYGHSRRFTKISQVGLVLDAGIEEDLLHRHLQVADATRASLGLPVVEYVVTDAPLQVEMWVDPACGKSTGRIKRPDSLLRAVKSLVNCAQVNAVAVVGRFPDEDIEETDDYRQGKGIDLLAGVESVISHLVVKEFQIPCAHAPAVSPLPLSPSLCPRSAAEEIGYTFLPCVLAGLTKAPQYINRTSGSFVNSCICASDVDSVILPIDAFGGDGALAFARNMKTKPLMIAVDENQTVLDDTPDKLGIEAVKVSNYWEAIGVIAAHKAGVDPNSLRRNRINNIRPVAIPSSHNGYVKFNAVSPI